MNVEVRNTKTAAEQGLSDAYAAVRAMLPGDPTVKALREEAFNRFEAGGLPNRRIEQWKYTDLRALMREAKPLAGAADASFTGVPKLWSGVDARLVAIVNGRYARKWSDANQAEPGVNLDDLLTFNNADLFQIGRSLSQLDQAYALNMAFLSGGVGIAIAKGVRPSKPIHLAHVFSGKAAASMYPRNVVVVEPGAHLTLIESFSGPDAMDYQVNSALELIVGDGAQVDHIKVGCDGDAALRVSTLNVVIGTKATYRDFAFTSGGAVVRNQTFARFGSSHSKGAIGGVSLLKSKQHVDNTLVITHAAPDCESRETFRTVLDGESHGVFQGKIVVEQQAQKTDAKMMTRALLLSDEAEADNKPELEIFADDVQCGHGATAGALDPGLKFYLMSRGISETEAEALLIEAFIDETIDQIAHQGIRDALKFNALKWLGTRG
jgi:Fe-S cluster assembly protein SufD